MYHFHFVKSVQIRSFIWSIFPRIRTKYGKIRTRENSVFEHFSHSVCLLFAKITLKTTNIRRKTTFQNGFQVLSMFYSDLKTATSLNNFLYYIFKHAVSSGFQHLPPLIFISHLLSHLHTETYTYTKCDRKQ